MLYSKVLNSEDFWAGVMISWQQLNEKQIMDYLLDFHAVQAKKKSKVFEITLCTSNTTVLSTFAIKDMTR